PLEDPVARATRPANSSEVVCCCSVMDGCLPPERLPVRSGGAARSVRGMDMEYRRLGRSGLKVSVLSFGSWVTFGPQLDSGLAADCMGAAFDAGVNFFDNAEAYAGGESERLMGEAIRKNGWKRHEYVVSSKFYWGIHDGPNSRL